jgi:hypothetical protein
MTVHDGLLFAPGQAGGVHGVHWATVTEGAKPNGEESRKEGQGEDDQEGYSQEGHEEEEVAVQPTILQFSRVVLAMR